MDYRKYILNSLDHMEVVKEFIEWSLKGMTDKSIVINDNIIMIDTLHTIEELVEQFKGTDVNIIDVTESNNFDTLDFTGFSGSLLNTVTTVYGDLLISTGMSLTAGKVGVPGNVLT